MYAAAFAQFTDSTVHCYTCFSTRQLYAPAILIRLIAKGHSEEPINNELFEEQNEMIARFKTRLDDYLQFLPLVVA